MCYVKEVLLVVDRAVKVACFYNDQLSLVKVAGSMSSSFLDNNLRHILLVLIFFG